MARRSRQYRCEARPTEALFARQRYVDAHFDQGVGNGLLWLDPYRPPREPKFVSEWQRHPRLGGNAQFSC